MKNLYLLIVSILISTSGFSQTQNYDITSKWFFGINGGVTWNTTDVDDKLDLGWGLTLGRSFNYDYGKILSFDLRGRYLRGYWYGQDYDTTDLSNYQGVALNPYQDSLGYTVNNFQSDLHRLSLELVVHLNWLREKTKFDPYVFGGVGATWYQTYGNLYDQINDKGSLYEYNTDGTVSFETINTGLDEIYETALDGSSQGNGNYNVRFMPSLGFGLGYQLNNQVSIGLEHKTTFTLRDDFDGYVHNNPDMNRENDLYHYTSGYLRFRFPNYGATAPTRAPSNSASGFTSGCKTPKIYLASNLLSTQTLTEASYLAKASIKYLGDGQVIFQNQKGDTLTYIYNASTNKFESNLALEPGSNTYTLTAINDCGRASKTFTINYLDCDPVSIKITSEQIMVREQNYTLTALIKSEDSLENISILLNNNSVTNFRFDNATNILTANLTLEEGENTILIRAKNECLADKKTISLSYIPCLEPAITFINPDKQDLIVNKSSFNFSAQITNYTKESITLMLNNKKQNDLSIYRAPNGLVSTVTKNMLLQEGINKISLTVDNVCGKITKEITVFYDNCDMPKLVLVSPVNTQTKTNKKTVSISVKANNIKSKSNLKVLYNNVVIPFDFAVSSQILSFSVVNKPGKNTLLVNGTNNCGTNQLAATIDYVPCVSPVVSILSPSTFSSTTKNAMLNFSGKILNLETASSKTITLKINGVAKSYQNNGGVITSTLTLAPGNNTIELIVNTDCGSASKTVNVFYDNCIAPAISISQPSAPGGTVNQTGYVFEANVSNMSANQSGITLTHNSIPVLFTFVNGVVKSNLILINGPNIIAINALNSCGNDSKGTTITYKNCNPPNVSVTSPVNNSTTTVGTSVFMASVSGINSAQSISLKVNGANKPFTFVNGVVSSSLSLSPGSNTIIISATNDCGSDVKSISLTYDNCKAPTVQISSPNSGTSVSNQSLSFSGLIQNMTSQSGITLKQNGSNKPFTFNNGTVSSTLSLTPGMNTITLSAVKSCGTDSKTIMVTYNNCLAPEVQISSPNSGVTVSNQSLSFSGLIQNMTSQSGITLKQNGSNKQFIFNNGTVSSTLTLTPGVNTITLSAVKSCGTDSKTIMVTYKNCDVPRVSIIKPTVSNTSSQTIPFKASVQGITNSQGITLTVNGSNHPFNFSNGTVNADVQLNLGLNKIAINVSNACGSDSKTTTITFKNCDVPRVSIIKPTVSNTSSQTIPFKASVQGITNSQGITLTVNGSNHPFNFSNGTVNADIQLNVGLNKIAINVSNACGSDSKTTTITYNNCLAPVVQITSPNNGITTTNSSVSFSATVQNMTSSSGIILKVNGVNNPFNFNSGNITANINLSSGNNTIVLSASKSCGSDSKTINVNYDDCVAPSLSLNNPGSNNVTVNQSNYVFQMDAYNLIPGTTVTFSLNGSSVPYLVEEGTIESELTLTTGTNIVNITISNPCGTATQTVTIVYNCSSPDVSIVTPNNNTTVNTNVFALQTNIVGVTSSQNIVLKVNGISQPFSFSNGILTATPNIQAGVNSVVVKASNSCGQSTATITVNYSPSNDNKSTSGGSGKTKVPAGNSNAKPKANSNKPKPVTRPKPTPRPKPTTKPKPKPTPKPTPTNKNKKEGGKN